MSEPGPGGGSAPERRDGLGRRFLLASVYLGAANWVSYALNFAIMIAIARLLGPADFGLYAYVFAINEFINIIGSFSLYISLVQAREAKRELFDTALAFCAGLGAIGLLITAAIAPVLWWTHSEQAAWMLAALAVARLFRLLAQVPQAVLEREIRYGPISVISVVTGNLPNIVAIGFAWIGMGAWTLIARDVLMTTLLLAMLIGWSGYRFRGHLDRESFRHLWAMGKRLFMAGAIGVLAERVDRVAIGSFLGNAATGLYQQARMLAETGNLAMRPVSQLALNLYARLQDDPVRLSRSHSLVNTLLVRIRGVGCVALWTFPGEVIELLLGREWLGAAPLLRWFALFAAVIPFTENVRVLFYGLGKVDRNLRVAMTQAAVIVPAALIACLAGELEWVAMGTVGASFVAAFVSWFLSRDLVESDWRAIFAVPVVLGVAICAVLEWTVAREWVEAVPWAARPFVPSLLFAAGILVVERSALFEEFRYLRAQLRTG